jgi:predicted membrane protein
MAFQRNSSVKMPAESPLVMRRLLITFSAVFTLLVYESFHNNALSPFDLSTLIIGGALFVVSVGVCKLVRPDYFADRRYLNFPLAVGALIIFATGAVIGVRVGFHAHEVPWKRGLPTSDIPWERSLQGFVTFFAIVPFALLLIDTRSRAIFAQKLEKAHRHETRKCKRSDKQDREAYQPCGRGAVFASLAMIFITYLLCHDSEGAQGSESRRRHV